MEENSKILCLRISKNNKKFYVTSKDLADAGPRFVIGIPERLSAYEGNPNGRTVAILLSPTTRGNYAVDKETVMAVLLAKPKAVRFIVPSIHCFVQYQQAGCDALLLPDHECTFPSKFYKNFRDGYDKEVKGDEYVVAAINLLSCTRREATLGIGRGCQLLGCAFGMLLEDVEGHDNKARIAHEVSLVRDDFSYRSLLYRIMGDVKTLWVNSHHKNALDHDTGSPNLRFGAFAPNNIVEAIELPDKNLIGVQWNPEQLVCDGNQQMPRLFSWLTTKSAHELSLSRVNEAVRQSCY